MGSAAREHLSVRVYGASHGSHDHDHFQILIGLDGVLDLEVEGHSQRIAPGDGVVLAPGERHDFEARAGAHCLVLDSTAPEWASAARPIPPAASALARYLGQACEQALPRAQALGAGLLLEAWRPAPPATQRARRAIDWRGLAEWASTRWAHEDIALTDLAQQVHLSASQLGVRCRAELGQSTQRWLRSVQLDHARSLKAQGIPVAEAARRSGYRSPSALTAALKRQSGKGR